MNDILANQNDINKSTRAQHNQFYFSRTANFKVACATLNKRRPIGFILSKDEEDS